MKLGLEGKVVLITGGSKGLGLACARTFAEEGARVSIASRSEENLARARQTLAGEGIDVVTVRADFSEEFAQAASPLNEGVPEVAIVRLKTLLARNPPDAEWRTAGSTLARSTIMARSRRAICMLDAP